MDYKIKVVSNRKRLIAVVVDILLSFTGAILLIVFDVLPKPIEFIGDFTYTYILASLIEFVYLSIFYSLFRGSSIGRLIVKSHIINKEYRRMSTGTSIIRALLQSLFILHIFNFFYQLFNKTQESLFGFITDTTCVEIVAKTHN